MSLPKPVLQIEPTDRCNLKCAMCSPQLSGAPPHVSVPRGDLDLDLYREIISGIAAEGPDFDHLILQWMGEPTLHADWVELLAFAVRTAGERFGYFRIDTNALRLDEVAARQVCDLATDNPGRPILLVFSLDSATPEAYRAVKGRDTFQRAVDNIERFLRLRDELVDVTRSPLNVQFQLVVQAGNADQVGDFIARWDGLLAELGTAGTHDEIMIKRVAIGTGGPEQEAADRRYDTVVEGLGLQPGPLQATHLCLWLREPWES